MFDLFKLSVIWEEFKAMPTKWKTIVVSMLVIVCALTGLVVLQGCASPSKSYVDANYKFSQLIVPDFIEYVKKDDSLSSVSKDARIKAAEESLKLNEQAYKESNE